MILKHSNQHYGISLRNGYVISIYEKDCTNWFNIPIYQLR